MASKAINRFFQFFRIDYEKLHNSKTEGLFWLDISMILLILFNLTWIIFEYSYSFESFQNIVEWISPRFNAWYGSRISPYFFIYDLFFVAIFITELTFRWIVAIVRKTYDRWFYYPFIHWYDVLGCIPLSTFRALRLLRVFSLFYRLQRSGIIDMTSTFIYKQVNKYLGILTEEVSDRVVVNVLNGVQDELQRGNPVADRVIRDVLLPKQHILATWLAKRVGDITLKTFEKNEHVIRRVLDEALEKSIRNNKEVARLKYIPGAGNLITEILNDSVRDVTFNSIKESIVAFSDPQNNAGLINDASHFTMEALLDEHDDDDQSLDDLVTEISVDILEIVKDEVKIQQWKEKEAERKRQKELNR